MILMYPSDKEPIENLLANRSSHFFDILSDVSMILFQSSSFNANAKVKNVFFFIPAGTKEWEGVVWRVWERGQRS